MFVHGPNLHGGGRMPLTYGIDGGLEAPFLNVVWATGSAWTALGRGRWGVKPACVRYS